MTKIDILPDPLPQLTLDEFSLKDYVRKKDPVVIV